MIDGKLWRWGTKELFFSSPLVTGLKCWHYTVTIKVCHWHGCEQKKHDVKSNVLGVHRQRIQNRIDTGKLRSQAQMIEAMVSVHGDYCGLSVRAAYHRGTGIGHSMKFAEANYAGTPVFTP